MIDIRMPEHGRIRLGIETTFGNGKRGPTSIDTFRFTSPDREAITALAQMYGGSVKPWRNDKATIISQQWEVVSNASSIPVFLPPGAINISFEIWGGGGIERRCDGHTAELYRGDDTTEKPCICLADGERTCKPYTRMKVILPSIPFGGVWRLESKGENAAAELPGMYEVLSLLNRSDGLLPATLSLEKRTTRKGGKKKIYVVPKLSVTASASDMLSGQGAISVSSRPAVAAPAPVALDAVVVSDPRMAEAKPSHLDLTDEQWEEALVRTCHKRGIDVEMVVGDLLSGVARVVQMNADGTVRLGRGRT